MMKSKFARHSLYEAFEKTDAILDDFKEQIIEEFELDADGDPSSYIYRRGDKIIVKWPAESYGQEGGFDKLIVTTHGLEAHASYPDDDYSEYSDNVTKLEWGTNVKLGKKAITAVCNYLYWGYADRWCVELIDKLSV